MEHRELSDEPGTDSLLNGNDVTRVRIAFNEDLNPLAELDELVPNISYSSEGLWDKRLVSNVTRITEGLNLTNLDLNEVLVRPRDRESGILPLLPDIEKHEVISAGFDEILTSGIGCKHARDISVGSFQSVDGWFLPSSFFCFGR